MRINTVLVLARFGIGGSEGSLLQQGSGAPTQGVDRHGSGMYIWIVKRTLME